MPTVSLSQKLLMKVLSSFVILTFFIAFAQVVFGYFSVKHNFEQELQRLEVTLNASLSQAIWELNEDQISAIGKGLSTMPMVKAVIVRDENNDIIFQGGSLAHLLDHKASFSSSTSAYSDSTLFGRTSPLTFKFSGNNTIDKKNIVGSLSLFSSHQEVFSKVLIQTIIPVLGMLLGIAILIYIIKAMFRTLLTTPLEKLSQDIARIDLDRISQSKLKISSQQQDELTLLAHSFNLMLTKLEEYKYSLEQTQQKLMNANQQLDRQNASLEQEVTRKTATLNKVIDKLAHQKSELEMSDLELRTSIEQLKQTQNQLVESEKMASLGSLVAGISHEINTPVGIGVTAVSYLSECIEALNKSVDNKSLSHRQMSLFLKNSRESASLLMTNLNKASQLIQSFKDIAVDQTSEAIRDVNLHKYLKEVIISLQPKLKRTQHQIVVNCEDIIIVRCRAGALSQIFTNMILNSLIHAFETTPQGKITFTLTQNEQSICIHYEDNGVGISSENLQQLFEPFFTTKRGQGGSGLGTHILYNIVTQSLKGTITAQSEQNQGLSYHIKFPRVMPHARR
ncbi:MAG: sensor histidine kinase [Gammaproteobacteria bacterium]|nr:sensor histidine kinase [Gammaproteobacteria bacterium]